MSHIIYEKRDKQDADQLKSCPDIYANLSITIVFAIIPTMNIGIIDFNPDQTPDRSQYVKRISSLLPEGTNYSGIFYMDIDKLDQYDALILSGSRFFATQYQSAVRSSKELSGDFADIDKAVKKISDYKGPIFGICFGAQILAHIHGAELGSLQTTEAGYLTHQLTEIGANDQVFKKLNHTFWGAQLHADFVKTLPKNTNEKADIIATRNGYIHAFRIVEPSGVTHYGTQPHPEMSNPNDATFLVRVNKIWLEDEIGAEAYKKAIKTPDDATFQLGSALSRFVQTLKVK